MREMRETSEWEGDREDVAAQALAALAGGSGEECGGCGAEIERTGSGWACPNGCFRALCPVCGRDGSDFHDVLRAPARRPRLRHRRWFYSPFDWDRRPAAGSGGRRRRGRTRTRTSGSTRCSAPRRRSSARTRAGTATRRRSGTSGIASNEALSVPVLEELWASPMYYTPRPAEAHWRRSTPCSTGCDEGFRRLAELRGPGGPGGRRTEAEEDGRRRRTRTTRRTMRRRRPARSDRPSPARPRRPPPAPPRRSRGRSQRPVQRPAGRPAVARSPL